MSKILITSFKPFGLIGIFIRQANASQDIAHLMKKRLNPDSYDFLVLPVSNVAPVLLRTYLDMARPAGIISLGENLAMLPNTIRIEPHAHDQDASLNPLGPAMSKAAIVSPFVKAAFPEQTQSSIGTYYCNAVYRTALQWTEAHNSEPVAFLHVSVLGNRHNQAGQVCDVVTAMRHQISPPPSQQHS